ncbi:MAG: co-chaperone GroES [Candidatus Pacebacteria bacterium]|nr:co-chaperone GroES [Candidatus Paceibacterota bacterium]
MKKIQSKEKESKIKPLGDRVLIKPISPDEFKKNTAGIIIPETVDKEKPEQGRVVAVGEGHFDNGTLVPVRVKKGQKVVFSKYGYDEIKIEGEEFYILEEKNILAIIGE